MYLHLYFSRLAFPREPAAAQSRLIEAYLDGYSPNVQEIIDNFEIRNHTPRLSKVDALGTLIEKFLDPIESQFNKPKPLIVLPSMLPENSPVGGAQSRFASLV